MRKNSEKCLICGKSDFKNSNGFTKHLRIHKISTENYYLFYVDYTAGVCEICGKEVKFRGIDYGFSKLCKNCNNKRNPNRIKKIKETMLRRYGSENASQVKQFKEKRKQTNLERYGVEHAMSNPEIFKRCVDTWEKNYESGHPGRDPEIKQKKKKTCQERYGVDNPSSVEEFKEKRKQTNLERYGVEHAMSNPKIYKKSEEKMLEKHGVRKALHKPEFLEKARKTNQKNRNVDWPMQAKEIVKQISGPNSYKWISDREQRFAPYTEKFSDKEYRLQIRTSQNNIDPLTGDLLQRNAHLHHIDYNKQNDSRENLIFLNLVSHARTNTNRKHWTNLLTKINEIFTLSQNK